MLWRYLHAYRGFSLSDGCVRRAGSWQPACRTRDASLHSVVRLVAPYRALLVFRCLVDGPQRTSSIFLSATLDRSGCRKHFP